MTGLGIPTPGFPGEVLACLDLFGAGVIAETRKRWV